MESLGARRTNASSRSRLALLAVTGISFWWHILESQVLNDKSFHRLLVGCEFVLNSRPHTLCSDDPSDLAPFTPNDILIPRPGINLPPGVHSSGEVDRKRWCNIQALTCQFWHKFYKEYVGLLSLQSKWLRTRYDVSLLLMKTYSERSGRWEEYKKLFTAVMDTSGQLPYPHEDFILVDPAHCQSVWARICCNGPIIQWTNNCAGMYIHCFLLCKIIFIDLNPNSLNNPFKPKGNFCTL